MAASACVPAAPLEAQDPMRSFELLDSVSQERLTRLKAQYDNLLPMEKRAFVGMLGLPLEAAAVEAYFHADAGTAAGYHYARYHSPEHDAVCRRRQDYVTLRQGQAVQGGVPRLDGPADPLPTAALANDPLAVSPDEFRRLLTPALFGEAPVPLQVKKESVYDRVGMLQGDEEEKAQAQAAAEAAAAAATESQERSTASEPTGRESGRTGASALPSTSISHKVSTVGTTPRTGEAAVVPPSWYRSAGYECLRLSHDLPPLGRREVDAHGKPLRPVIVNLTGVPLGERDRRVWFNWLAARLRASQAEGDASAEETAVPPAEAEAEAEARGELPSLDAPAGEEPEATHIDVRGFMDYIISLDRAFGVPTFQRDLERECLALATDGDKISFPAFSRLVSRFLQV